MQKHLLSYHPLDNACLYNRVYLPTIYSKPKDIKITLTPTLPKFCEDADGVMLQGVHDVSGIVDVMRWKVRGKKFVWTIDDDYLNIPEWNGNTLHDRYREFHQMATALADTIIVSTEELKKTFTRQDVKVCPNLMLPGFPCVEKKKNKTIRILWQGSSTHKEDVAIIEEALGKILEDYHVEVIFWGDYPPTKLYNKYLYKGLRVQPPVKITKYYSTLKKLTPDIIVAPLIDCHFNRCKSNLRILDAWFCGAAVVASSVGEYKCINPGVDGMLAANGEEFLATLKLVIEDKTLRQELQTNGHTRMQDDYSWLNPICRKKWDDVLEEVV